MLTQIFFCYCTVMMIGSGLLAMTLRSPLHSILLVFVLFVHLAGIFLTLQAEFLAAMQLLVTTVMLLLCLCVFLFPGERANRSTPLGRSRSFWFGAAITLGLLCCLLVGLWSFAPLAPQQQSAAADGSSSLQLLATQLFSHGLLPFAFAAVLLFIGLIGGLLLLDQEQQTRKITAIQIGTDKQESH